MKTIGLPDGTWGRLATAADDRGCTIEDLLVATIQQILRPHDRKQMILALVRAGYPDKYVAEYSGELVQFVSTVRRDAGLPANKARPRNATYAA